MRSSDSKNSEERGRADSAAQALLNAMPDILILMELDGTILSANEAACAQLNGQTGGVVRKNFYDLLPSHVLARYKRAVEKAIRSGKPHSIDSRD